MSTERNIQINIDFTEIFTNFFEYYFEEEKKMKLSPLSSFFSDGTSDRGTRTDPSSKYPGRPTYDL